MHLAVWSLRLFYLLIVAIGLLFILLPPGLNGPGVFVALISFMIAGLIEGVVQALLRSEKWAWRLALLICVLLTCSLWFTIFGLFGLWGLLSAKPIEVARGRSFNPTTQRPSGANIIVAAQLLLGVLSLLGVALNNPLASQLVAQSDSSEEFLVWSFILAIAILSLCMACGVYFLQRWAWYGTLITQGIALSGFISFIFMGQISLLLHFCFSLVAVGYLLDPNVKYALRH